MGDADAYVMLVSSLPRSERLFRAKLPPLSRERLDRRLRLLSPEDAACLALIESVLSWSSHDLDETDAAASLAAERALARITRPTVRAIVEERLEMRTIVAALRHRRARKARSQAEPDAPPSGRWGVGPIVRRIEARWTDPTFGLAAKHPWLPRAAALIDANDPLGLERHVLATSLQQLNRRGATHLFDFEAVVIYALKWSIFDRWARSDAVAARARFDRLATAALAAVAADESMEIQR